MKMHDLNLPESVDAYFSTPLVIRRLRWRMQSQNTSRNGC